MYYAEDRIGSSLGEKLGAMMVKDEGKPMGKFGNEDWDKATLGAWLEKSQEA